MCVLAGCSGSGTPTTGAEPSGEAIERSEEDEQKKREAAELVKDREVLSSVEGKQQEEAAEVNARRKEAAAEAKAKKRLEAAEKAAKAKEKAAEALLRKSQAEAKALAEKRSGESTAKSTPHRTTSPKAHE
jgi:hypothetical protein